MVIPYIKVELGRYNAKYLKYCRKMWRGEK